MKFFISYRRREMNDQRLAEFLFHSLQGAGHEVFIDTRMELGTDWVAKIAEKIGWCEVFVVLISEGALTSEMVQGEVRMAHQRRKATGTPRIAPVRVKYDGPLDYELNSYLGRLQYVTWQSDNDSGPVLDAVLQMAAGAGDAGAAGAPPPDLPTAPPAGLRPPRTAVDPRILSSPGGTVRADNPLYIQRAPDRMLAGLAGQAAETVVIKAPRQMGKSSMLLRYLRACQTAGKRVAFVDFQAFADVDLEDYPTMLSQLAAAIARSLRLTDAAPRIDTQMRLTIWLEDVVLPAVGGPMVLALDEVDRLLGRPFQSDFFSLLRSWHNSRAGFQSVWEQVGLALVISTEPYLLIAAADRSPFNVTPPIDLEPLTRDQCAELGQRHGSPLDAAELDALYELLRGHPYLTRLAFYRLVQPDAVTLAELLQRASDENGPFGDHLRTLLMKLHAQPDLTQAMRQVIATGRIAQIDLYHRLHGAGLVRRSGDRIDPANPLYARFLKGVL